MSSGCWHVALGRAGARPWVRCCCTLSQDPAPTACWGCSLPAGLRAPRWAARQAAAPSLDPEAGSRTGFSLVSAREGRQWEEERGWRRGEPHHSQPRPNSSQLLASAAGLGCSLLKRHPQTGGSGPSEHQQGARQAGQWAGVPSWPGHPHIAMENGISQQLVVVMPAERWWRESLPCAPCQGV